MNKKVVIIILIMIATTFFTIFLLLPNKKTNHFYIIDDIKMIAMTEEQDFMVYNQGEMKKTFLKGVNIGATTPGSFPGELSITKEEYLRWFQMISDMNANVIRVYTTMMPWFYEALLEFNEKSESPLYVLHGVWVNEDTIYQLQDPYANEEEIINEFKQDAIDLVDIFHGNITIPSRPGFAYGTYHADVSPYVVGWILGTEWSPTFVIETNLANPDKTSFSGEYLYTIDASPFEVFLAEVGDYVLSYEIENYQTTRPLSYTNWLTTDALNHDNEPDLKEDMVSVNTEHIKTTELAVAGMFASYHVYPYYPEFMNYQPEYQNFIDPISGEKNPYKAYLLDLISSHTVPVLVAEYGIPSSRGKAHDSANDGYNQGNHTEIEQGEILVKLFNDIVDSNYMGALIFSWQDEWFKRTWNTMDFDLAWRRPFWSNVETNEQFFGLLSFDPGQSKMLIHTDGNQSDWDSINPISIDGNQSISVTSDPRYLYILVENNDFDWLNDKVYIPIDTISNQGNLDWTEKEVSFDREADFVVLIDGMNESKILVDPYYDSFEYLYSDVLKLISSDIPIKTKNNGYFQPMMHVLSARLTLPRTNTVIPFSSYETGALHYGNSDPESQNFDSLSDFYFGENFVEIRIPWLLLNVMDPSTKQIISDFDGLSYFVPETTNGFYVGAVFSTSETNTLLSSALYDWQPWEELVYHERLKQSYYIVKEAFYLIN